MSVDLGLGSRDSLRSHRGRERLDVVAAPRLGRVPGGHPPGRRVARACGAHGGSARLYIARAPRRITQRILKLRVVPFSKVLDFRTTSSQNCEAVPRRACI